MAITWQLCCFMLTKPNQTLRQINQISGNTMKTLIYLCLLTYFSFYLFESPIRYGFNAVGADFLIFIRDLILILPLALNIFIEDKAYKSGKNSVKNSGQNSGQKRIHPAFYIFTLIILVHGIIGFLNIGNWFIIFYCIKMLLTALVGAVIAPYLMNPPKEFVRVIFAFWIVTFIGVFIDKYDILTYPWTGLKTVMGDMQVDISRDWEITGEDKRAGGLLRSSINVAVVTPLLAFIMLFNMNIARPYLAVAARLTIMVMTVMVLYWSTQKASIVAFIFTCILLTAAHKRPIPALKIGISLAFILMILLPIILPQFIMPNGEGVFSLASFYMRVEDMWPRAWLLIERKEIFPFGVGLGGIGGAQRFYSPEDFNAADNMFILLYAFFGIFSFVYMGWLWLICVSANNKAPASITHALSIVLFIAFYGVALSMIEDQMASLFLGAAAAWLASNRLNRRSEDNAN